jgi:hypothetical protein
MTVPDVPDASEADELASALLDGEGTAAERARADEPDVARRVAELEAVARLVATPVEPVDELARSRAVRAALAAAAPAVAPRRVPAWLAPAAAVIVVLAGVGLFVAVLAGGSDDADEAATSGADTATEATALAEGGGESFQESAGDAAGGAGSEAPAAAMLADDLGAFDEPPQLAEALRARLAAAPRADDDAAAARRAELDAAGCTGAFEASTVLDVARATLNGRPVLVVVLERADGRLGYAAVAEPTCETLAAGDL